MKSQQKIVRSHLYWNFCQTKSLVKSCVTVKSVFARDDIKNSDPLFTPVAGSVDIRFLIQQVKPFGNKKSAISVQSFNNHIMKKTQVYIL